MLLVHRTRPAVLRDASTIIYTRWSGWTPFYGVRHACQVLLTALQCEHIKALRFRSVFLFHILSVSPSQLFPFTLETYHPFTVMSLWQHRTTFLLLICKEWQLRSYLNEKVAAPVWKTEINGCGNSLRCLRNTLYPQRLALTSPTSGGCSVGIVRLRTTDKEFSFEDM
jgi:hypothetical protein